MFKSSFWSASFERAFKTLAQAAVALLVGSGVGLLEVDWISVASVAGLAFVVSILTSIGSGYVGEGNGPSLSSEHLDR